MTLLRWQRERKQRDPRWYRSYLRPKHWRETRQRAIKASNYTCQRCKKRDRYHDAPRSKRKGARLQVHHLTYARVGNERDSDLRVLCIDCHRRAHMSIAQKIKSFVESSLRVDFDL
jgi:5-methylcytosine-specific restriction endonuclease McrA